jgi:hypothetical protein
MDYSSMAAFASEGFSYSMKEYVTLFSFFFRMSDLMTPNSENFLRMSSYYICVGEGVLFC